MMCSSYVVVGGDDWAWLWPGLCCRVVCIIDHGISSVENSESGLLFVLLLFQRESVRFAQSNCISMVGVW